MLCDNLERWGGVGGGREVQEGAYVLIHVDVWQKPTQPCKAIILQLKINTLKKIKCTTNVTHLNHPSTILCPSSWGNCLP